MKNRPSKEIVLSWLLLSILLWALGGSAAASGTSSAYGEKLYNPGQLKPIDSHLKVKVGQVAPDFALPSIKGGTVRLSQYRGHKQVLLSFIPAAWTPVCSDQWPGYNLAAELFQAHDTQVIGISVDNRPTLFAWTREMGELWFEVLSDFWPHGKVSDRYGVLRSDGTAERAIVIIDKAGIIRFIHVEDINRRPELGMIMEELAKISGR